MPPLQTIADDEGLDVPYDRISPDTLKIIIEEYVTREWSSLTDFGYTIDDRVEQVVVYLKMGRLKIVFNISAETLNIVKVS
jgi:uncharacterized protein YheU (UPF0270 family)